MAGGILGGLGGASLLNRSPSPFDLAQRRLIHEKSWLEFHFPTEHVLVARLPLYENIDIKESKSANIVTYNPIGRNSSLYTYTGAQSRQLKISFALTLLHIQSMHHGAKIRFNLGDDPTRTSEEIKKQMLRKSNSFEATQAPGVGTVLAPTPTPEDKKEARQVSSEPLNWVEYVAWWTNLIRSSVLSNQWDTSEGPPVIRLNHGELYQNIPCICKSYDISYDKNAGMDVDSLLSRRILVTMNLEEFRAGNFGEFDRTSTDLLERDNVAGWEAIIAYSSTDPGHDAIQLSERVLDARVNSAQTAKENREYHAKQWGS
tara:strand:- start:4442 stop:5389 length:948 start_codon:yes stop_codon:yes gene_type:complete